MFSLTTTQEYYLSKEIITKAQVYSVTREEIYDEFVKLQDDRQIFCDIFFDQFINYLFTPISTNIYKLRTTPSNKHMLYFGTHPLLDNQHNSKDDLAKQFSFKDKHVLLAQGNFGPPHRGHFEFIRQALTELKCDILIIYCVNEFYLNIDSYDKICRHPYPLTSSFVLWQEYCELYFQVFPNIEILFCDRKYKNCFGFDEHTCSPMHFSSLNEKASFSWIRSIEMDKNPEMFNAVLEWYTVYKVPICIEKILNFKNEHKWSVLAHKETDLLRVYYYPRITPFSSTAFADNLKKNNVVTKYFPDGLSTQSINLCLEELKRGNDNSSNFEKQVKFIKNIDSDSDSNSFEVDHMEIEMGIMQDLGYLDFLCSFDSFIIKLWENRDYVKNIRRLFQYHSFLQLCIGYINRKNNTLFKNIERINELNMKIETIVANNNFDDIDKACYVKQLIFSHYCCVKQKF